MNNILEISITGNNSYLKKSLQDSRAELKRFADEVKRGGGDVKTAMASERLEGQKLTNAMKEVRLESARLTLEKKKTSSAVTAASGSYREAQQRLTALGKSIREAAGGFSNTSPAIRKQIQEYNQLNTKLKDFDKTMGNHQRNVGNYGSAFASAIPVVGQFTSVAGLASAGVAGLQKSFAQNIAMDAFKTALKEISGDGSEFNKNLGFLRETSERLGLDFMSTAQAFKQWQGAAKFSNLTADESRKIFESVANASAKMKLSSDQTTGAFLALSQMLSKGKVQAEELRGQLGERLPGAFALAAKALGVTEQGLNKMLEKGEVVANDFLPKFAAQLDKSFGNDKTEKIQSMQAEVNRLSNAWDNLFNSDNATSFFTEVSKGLANTVTEFDKTINSKSWKEFFLRLGGGISTGITSTLMGAAADSQRYANQVTPLQRSVNRNLGSFNDLNNEQKKLKLQEQQAVVTRLSKEYNEKKDKETLDRLTYQNATLAEMNKLYYGQLETKKQINTLDEGGKKPKGKSQADLIKESNEALRGGQIDNLKGIDNELAKIDKKWDSIVEKINLIGNISKKNELLQIATAERALAKEEARFKAEKKRLELFSKQKLKQVGIAPGTVTPTLPGIPSLAPLQNSFAGWTAGLSKGLEKDDRLENSISRIIERGFKQGIGSILDNITELGSDFQSVFTNVFGQLRNTLQGIFNDIVGTRLGDLFKSNFDDIDLGGLGNKVSQAVVAGAGLVGQLVSGMTSQTSALGQGLGGAISGAAMGTAILPGIGTAVGAVLGGLSGIFGAKKAREQERLQQEQLAESKRQTLLQERIAALSYTSSIVGSRTNLGTVTGIDRDAFGNIEGIVDGKNLKLVIERN